MLRAERSPYGKVKLVDEDWEVNLAEEKVQIKRVILLLQKTNKSRALGRF